MRYLAIDLGDKRTGIAAGDDVTGIVSPLDQVEVGIHLNGGTALLEALARVVERQIGPSRPGVKSAPSAALIFGLPINMDGSEGPRARIVRAFAARLAARTGLALHFQDERLTTAEADWTMAGSGLTRGQKKERRDGLAAAAILRDHLAAQSKPAEPAPERDA
jgi:putative Holliday junction resolvase